MLSGFLDRDELKSFLEESDDEKLSPQELESALAYFDDNNDEQVDLNEFVKWIKSQNELSNSTRGYHNLNDLGMNTLVFKAEQTN
jgi:Ca2+-binding EF-hand superfamily protein